MDAIARGRRPRRARRLPRAGPGWSRLVSVAAWMVGATAAMLLVALVALWIYAGPSRAPQRHVLVIPAGLSEAVASGANPLELPATWALRSGDSLVVDNRDRVVHTVGTWMVAPGSVRTVELRPQVAALVCSLHPSGSITLDVTPARTDWWLAGIAALAFGPALGLGGYGLRRVAQALSGPPGGEVAA